MFNAICLCLEDRFDHYKSHIEPSCEKLGINCQPFLCGKGKSNLKLDHIDINELPPRLEFSTSYPTWWKSTNAYNAYLCHKKMLELVEKKEYDEVLFLEDDSVFEDDFVEILSNSKYNDLNWSMLYLGSYLEHARKIKVNDHLYKVEKCGGFHGVLIKQHMLPHLLSFPPIGPIDDSCGRFIHHNFPCYAIYPPIISQKSGFSFIEQNHLEKPSRYVL